MLRFVMAGVAILCIVPVPAITQTAHDFHGVWDLEPFRENAEKNPDGVTGCGIGASSSVYVTNKVCYVVMAFSGDNYDKLKPSAGDDLINQCSMVSQHVCLAMIEEMKNLSSNAESQSAYVSIDECADRLAKEISGGDKTQYLNQCQQLLDYFK